MHRQKQTTLAKALTRTAVLLAVVAGAWLLLAEPNLNAERGNDRPEAAEDPEAPEVTLTLRKAHAAPGTVANVRLRTRTNVPVSMIAWSVEFDPTFLAMQEPPVLSQPLQIIQARAESPKDFRFEWQIDNEAGWAQFFLVVDFQGRPDHSIPAGMLMNAVTLPVLIKLGTPIGEYPIRFTDPETASYDGSFLNGAEFIYNAARPAGSLFSDDDVFEETLAPVVEDGIVEAVIGDVGFFLKGDANLDDALDISDPMAILSSLFLGGSELPCPDVADTNDDGRIDLSDSVAILSYLFRGIDAGEFSMWTIAATTDDAVECELDAGSPQ
jgi:hypothetical protein